MNAATMKSQRLQRVRELLSDGAEHTTREIIEAANVCAVNSIVAELRANGVNIVCRRGKGRERGIWFYMEVLSPKPVRLWGVLGSIKKGLGHLAGIGV